MLTINVNVNETVNKTIQLYSLS